MFLQSKVLNASNYPAMNPEKVYSWIGRIAPVYELLASLLGYKKSVDFFVSELPFSKKSPIKVLDAGCGTGLYVSAILEQYPNSSVTAFDFSEKLIEALRKKTFEKYPDRLRLFTADIQGSLIE